MSQVLCTARPQRAILLLLSWISKGYVQVNEGSRLLKPIRWLLAKAGYQSWAQAKLPVGAVASAPHHHLELPPSPLRFRRPPQLGYPVTTRQGGLVSAIASLCRRPTQQRPGVQLSLTPPTISGAGQ